MWNNNRTTLLFMAIALVGFMWVKILPYFPNRPEHETGKISLPKPKDLEGSKILNGYIISSQSDTLCSVGIVLCSDNSDFQKWDGSLAKEQVIESTVDIDVKTTAFSEDSNKFDIAALDSLGTLFSIQTNTTLDSATGTIKKSEKWLIANPGYFDSKHITEGCTFVINPR